MSSLFGNFYANIWVIDCVTKYLGAFLTVRTAYEKILPLRGRIFYEGENETYIEASVENSSSILYDKEIRNKPRTRRTKRNV